MYKKYLNLLVLITIVVYATSCVDTRKATYFVDAPETVINTRPEDSSATIIEKNDIISITITSLSAEASAIFNMPGSTANNGNVTNTGNLSTGNGYLVNSDGYVQLPILGYIKVSGFTTKYVKEEITEMLVQKKLLIDPIVTIRHLNYEVTVIGEVAKPTVINVPNEKISLLKALGIAGDITLYGKKDNVLLIREVGGKRQVKRIDLNSADFLYSPYYYLRPNDVIYVEANKNKIASASAVRQTLPIILSGLSIILLALDRIIK